MTRYDSIYAGEQNEQGTYGEMGVQGFTVVTLLICNNLGPRRSLQGLYRGCYKTGRNADRMEWWSGGREVISDQWEKFQGAEVMNRRQRRKRRQTIQPRRGRAAIKELRHELTRMAG